MRYISLILVILALALSIVIYQFRQHKGNEMRYAFADPQNTACISCVHVIKYSKPILNVYHDQDDGCWQFLCGDSHNESQAMVVGLGRVIAMDDSLNELYDLGLGESARRNNGNDQWKRQ